MRQDRKKTKYVDPALKRKPPAPRPGAKGRKASEKEELKGEGETKAADDAEEPSKPKKKKPKVEDGVAISRLCKKKNGSAAKKSQGVFKICVFFERTQGGGYSKV